MEKMLPANGDTFDDAVDSLAVQEFWREAPRPRATLQLHSLRALR